MFFISIQHIECFYCRLYSQDAVLASLCWYCFQVEGGRGGVILHSQEVLYESQVHFFNKVDVGHMPKPTLHCCHINPPVNDKLRSHLLNVIPTWPLKDYVVDNSGNCLLKNLISPWSKSSSFCRKAGC